jgi:serine/threonine-protein kinase RsbW
LKLAGKRAMHVPTEEGMSKPAAPIVELRIPSQLRFLAVVDAVVQSFAADFGWEADDVNNLGTAAIEAVSNAMEHGNRFDENLRVLLRLSGDAAGMEVEVEDEGVGFDPQPYERELTPDDLLKLRGRGIFIMRSFMDGVSFAPIPGKGMRVTLRKRGAARAQSAGGPSGGA